jgi:uncharacterized membrane protein YdjX (TVP38/TMEM64 family)
MSAVLLKPAVRQRREPSPAIRRTFAIALFCFSIALAAGVIANKHAIDLLLAQAGPWAYPIAIGVLGIVAAAPFSVTDALAVSNGVVFGPVIGSLVNAAGLFVGSILSYYVARRTCKWLDVAAHMERLPDAVKRFPAGSPLFLIFVRIIPGVGGTLATQIAAALHVRLWRHVVTFLIVTVPFCTLLAFGGSAASHEIHRLWLDVRHGGHP